MNLFKKLFGNNEEDKEKTNAQPDNTKLISYINNWTQNPSYENYMIVVNEFTDGNSYLLLPSVNDKNALTDEQTTKADTTLQLTCIFNMDGLKVLGAFTDENALFNWSNTPTTYTELKSKAVTALCEKNNIRRIVINSGSKHMFVLEHNKGSLKELTVEEGATVQIGTPAKPLDKRIIDNLVARFKEVDTIEEAYQYLLGTNKELNIRVGVKLSINSENAKKAVLYAVQDAMRNEKSDQFIDIFFIETDSSLKRIRNVSDSLFYKK